MSSLSERLEAARREAAAKGKHVADPAEPAVAAAPTEMRPLSRLFIAKTKPLPVSPPSSASPGTRTSSSMMSEICEPDCPIFLSGEPVETPGAFIGTRKALTCAFLGSASLLVRAMISATSAWGALVIYRLVPFKIQPLPSGSGTAVV